VRLITPRWAIVIGAASIAGCVSITAPVLVSPKNGDEPLRGTVTVDLSGGKFGVANSKIQCSGEYPNALGERVVTITARCSDGRTGAGTAVRTAPRGGSGTMRMSDGAEAIFAYGSEVAAPTPQPVTAMPAGPSGAPPAKPENANSDTALVKCTVKAASFLDDGISSADAVAEAALEACRPEMEAICLEVEQRHSAPGYCSRRRVDEFARQLRPTITGKILQFRAGRRIFRQPSGGVDPKPGPRILTQ
jgi:hypothetical protein